jgi:hypothetical protein
MAQTLIPPRPSLEDPEPEPVAPWPGRRTVGPAHVIIAMTVCLGLWAVLFAPVLLRNAETGPVGTRRTIALSVLRPLARAADALAFDRAGDLVLEALGRDPDAPPGGELELPDLDLDLPPLAPAEHDPTPPGPTPRTAASPTPEGDRDHGDERDADAEEPQVGIRAPSEDAKLRVAVIGDSLAQGLGPSIVDWFDPDVSRVLPLGRQSTGLARLDYFNWQLALRRIEEEFRPDLVFVMLGSNDAQAQVTPDGREVPVGSFAWTEAYRERAATFLEEATSAGTHVVWVGIPIVRDHQRWDFYRRVNAIYREAAAADPFAAYVDSWDLLRSHDGDYTAFLRNERGVLQEMRASDGIHFTPTGYAFLARSAIRVAAEAFDLPQRAVMFRI